jgi:thiol-disulfide isomerase/thioredoxin
MKKLAFLFSLSILFGCYGKDPERTGLEGKLMPSFDLLLADSVTNFNTNRIPPDKPIVLFCFGPNCPYSRAQMQSIIDNMESLKDLRFYIFTPFSFTEMKGFYTYYKLNKYQNVTVGIDKLNFFNSYFRAPGVPYIAIFGKDKKLREAFVGEVSGKQIREIAGS